MFIYYFFPFFLNKYNISSTNTKMSFSIKDDTISQPKGMKKDNKLGVKTAPIGNDFVNIIIYIHTYINVIINLEFRCRKQ